MSAVSASSPLSSPEPVSRRRMPEADAGRDAAPFSLPEETAAESKPAPGQEKAEAKPTERGATPPTVQGGAASSPAGTPTDPAKPTATPVPAPLPQAAETPAPVVAQPKPDVGALVAIAEAEQAVAGELGETITKPKKTEGDGKDEAGTADAAPDGSESLALLPMPAPDPAAATPPLPPAAGQEQVPQPVAAGAGQVAAPGGASTPDISATSAASGQQAAAIIREMVPVVAVPEIPGELAQPEQAEAPAAAAVPAEAADKALRLANVTKLPFDAAAFVLAGEASPDSEALAAAVAGATQKSSETAGTSHAKAAKGESTDAAASAGAATAPVEGGKPAEAVQQPGLTAIDFSHIVHQRAGKPEPAPMPGADPAATVAQQQIATGHQGANDGPPTPLHIVPVEIGLRALAGSKRFDIRLDPGELGRIDVNLEISDKGEVSARLVVDRVETLHLLQRDARTLERAFEQAGLKPSDAGVDISLRDPGDQSAFRQNRQDEQAPRHNPRAVPETDIDDVAIAAQPVPVRRLVRLGGVDTSI